MEPVLVDLMTAREDRPHLRAIDTEHGHDEAESEDLLSWFFEPAGLASTIADGVAYVFDAEASLNDHSSGER